MPKDWAEFSPCRPLDRFAIGGAKTDAQSAPYFIASGQAPTPSHRDDGPNGLPPKQPPALDARSTCRGPTRTALRPNANNRLSKYTPDLEIGRASCRER